MEVNKDLENNTLKVILSGEIDHHTSLRIRQKTDEEIEKMRPETLIFDCTEVTFMDSSAVGLIMGRYRILNSWNGKIEVVNLNNTNYKMMKIAGMQSLCSLRKRDKNEENK